MVVPRDAPRWAHVVVFFVIAAATLGVAGYTSSSNMVLDQPNKDIWQHVASVRALMENLASPQNPFIVSQEPSRHFQPLWVATAAVARVLDLTVWQAMTFATYAIMTTLMLAVYSFARVYFGSPWAPSILLSVMLLAWWAPYEHTGLHSMSTLLYGAGYPATLMIALSLLLWAAVIKALEDRRYLPVLVALAALMLVTHQLGAVIGFIGAFAFAVAQPGAPGIHRLQALLAGAFGVLLALFWPYFGVLELTFRGGSSTWEGGPDFYSSPWMPEILIPAGLGLLWMWHRRARGLALALFLFVLAYLPGFLGIQIASRFLMPVVLVLHIGLAGVLLDASIRVRRGRPLLRIAVPWLAAAGIVLAAANTTIQFQMRFDAQYSYAPDVYAAAERMTKDIPNDEPMAAFGITAWPVVATGQKVYSVPWPEPGIADLVERQTITEALFDAGLTSEERRAMAENHGVRILIADRRLMPPELLASLADGAVSISQESTLYRFDLWD